MLLSAVSVLFVAQSSSEIPEGLMNNPVLLSLLTYMNHDYTFQLKLAMTKSIPYISNSRCKFQPRTGHEGPEGE